jgi:ubiquinone/menaquinone biosynthesis C-methylase UbiE
VTAASETAREPTPAQKEPPRIFTPEYYQRMRELEERGWWNAAMRDVAAFLLERARPGERGRMLDVGCGSGQTMEWLRTRLPGWETHGIDVALDGLRAGAAAGVTRLTAGSALAIPYPDASVDLIITLDVLQHLPLEGGDLRALKEMRRVLRDGGSLLVRTNAQAFPRAPDDPEHDFHKFEPDELRAKLRSAGFRVDRLSRINALLGLAEIPREIRAGRQQRSTYHGIMATAAGDGGPVAKLKKAVLRLEGRAVAAGIALPLGRTIVALCSVARAGEPGGRPA